MRRRQAVGIAGLPGAGKTTKILQMIEAYKHGKVAILDKFNDEKYVKFPTMSRAQIPNQVKGIYKVQDPEPLKVVDAFSESFEHGLLVLEDASAYIPSQEYKPMLDLFSGRRHEGVDLILTFHSINRIPPFCLEQFDKLVLFKTNDNPEKYLKGNVPNPDLVTETWKRVNEHQNPFHYWIIDLRQPSKHPA